jgi:hypothetical protein
MYQYKIRMVCNLWMVTGRCDIVLVCLIFSLCYTRNFYTQKLRTNQIIYRSLLRTLRIGNSEAKALKRGTCSLFTGSSAIIAMFLCQSNPVRLLSCWRRQIIRLLRRAAETRRGKGLEDGENYGIRNALFTKYCYDDPIKVRDVMYMKHAWDNWEMYIIL